MFNLSSVLTVLHKGIWKMPQKSSILKWIHSTLKFLQSTYNKKTNYNMNWRWHTYNLPFWIIFCSCFFQTCLYVSYWVEISNLWVSKLSRTSDENRLSLLQKWKQGIIFSLSFLGFDILSLRPSALQSLTFKFWPSPQILSVLDKATHRNAVHWLYKAKLWAHECYVHCTGI